MGGAGHYLYLFLAKGGGTPGPVNIKGMTDLATSIVGLLVLVAGAGLMLRVHARRDFGAAAGAVAVLLLGLAVVGLALSGDLQGVAKGLAGLIF